jgi:hypothetical protein
MNMASRIRPFSDEDSRTLILSYGDVRIWPPSGLGVAGSPSRMRRWWFPLTGLRNCSKRHALVDIQDVDKVEESGPLAGHGITTRFRVLRGPGNVPVCALEA